LLSAVLVIFYAKKCERDEIDAIKFHFATATLVLLFVLCGHGISQEIREDFREYFEEFNVSGTFVLFNRNEKRYTYYNRSRAYQKVSPASTFKIANTLIGLDMGVIPNERYVFKWDGRKRNINKWNQDLVLRDAFQFSCVPCYQDVARRIGKKKMKIWLRKIAYGNNDISGGIDRFWLGSSLKISAKEQVKFLRRLYYHKFLFSKEHHELVKKIMLVETTPQYKLYAKTGWAISDGKNIGWYVGFVEKNGNVYFFATNIETQKANEDFAKARIEITKNILKKINVL